VFVRSLWQAGVLVAVVTLAAACGGGSSASKPDVSPRSADVGEGGSVTRVSVSTSGEQANHQVDAPAISGDGRFVAFHTLANNLVVNDGNGLRADIFVRDRTSSSG
jgi:hypothetical protein